MRDRLSAEVVERALAGDPTALTRLVETHQDELLNLAFRITGDAEASWEITSDVFLRLLEHPASVAGREGEIREPLLHGVWVLARGARVRNDQLPQGDRAVEAVAAAAVGLPATGRAALALVDLLGADRTLAAAALGSSPGAFDELLTESRLALAAKLGIRGRDRTLVEAEAVRVYGLWPAEQADPMAPDIVAEGERRGLVGTTPGLAGDVPVIAGIRITPAVGLALLLVPLLIAAAIAVAVRSGGGDGDPVAPTTGPALVGTDGGTSPLPPVGTDGNTSTTGTSTTGTGGGVVSTVSSTATEPPAGGGTPAPTPSPSPTPATTAQTPAPTPTTVPATTATPTVTRAPGGGAPPRPTSTASTPAPTTTSGGGQPPAPETPGGGEVPLP